MGNGVTILQKEVAEDLKMLERTEPPKSCKFAGVVKEAVKRSLRLAEQAYKASSRNTKLLVLLLVFTVKVEGVGLVELILKVLLKGL